MSAQRLTPELKEEAVKQKTERGHSVAEVAARSGVSTHSLYQWAKAVSSGRSEQPSQELLEAKSKILRQRSCGSATTNKPHGARPDQALESTGIWRTRLSLGKTRGISRDPSPNAAPVPAHPARPSYG